MVIAYCYFLKRHTLYLPSHLPTLTGPAVAPPHQPNHAQAAPPQPSVHAPVPIVNKLNKWEVPQKHYFITIFLSKRWTITSIILDNLDYSPKRDKAKLAFLKENFCLLPQTYFVQYKCFFKMSWFFFHRRLPSNHHKKGEMHAYRKSTLCNSPNKLWGQYLLCNFCWWHFNYIQTTRNISG